MNQPSNPKKTEEEHEKNANPAPNFFLIIPSHILDDPEINDSTAILYGRIVSLSNNKGYCFASDKYLAELTGVSHQEVGKRLLVLEKAGYIRRETKKIGLHWDRKIYPNFNYENAIRRDRARDTAEIENAIRRTEQDKSYKDKNTTMPPPSSGGVVISFLDKLTLSDSLRAKVLNDFSEEQIITAVERCLKWKGRPSDESGLMTALKKGDDWIDYDSPAEKMEKNKAWLEKNRHLDGKLIGCNTIIVGPDYIEITAGMNCKVYKVENEDFIKKSTEHLIKIGALKQSETQI